MFCSGPLPVVKFSWVPSHLWTEKQIPKSPRFVQKSFFAPITGSYFKVNDSFKLVELFCGSKLWEVVLAGVEPAESSSSSRAPPPWSNLPQVPHCRPTLGTKPSHGDKCLVNLALQGEPMVEAIQQPQEEFPGHALPTAHQAGEIKLDARLKSWI